MLFAYVSIMLAVLQVGLGTEQTVTDTSFQLAAYRFTMCSILVPVMGTVVVILGLTGLFVFHLVGAMRYEAMRRQEDRAPWEQEGWRTVIVHPFSGASRSNVGG